MTSAPLPRLVDDLRTTRVERDGRVFVKLTTSAGDVAEMLNERTFDVLSALAGHDTLDKWVETVTAAEPSATRERLIGLLDKCTRLGILTNRPAPVPAPVPGAVVHAALNPAVAAGSPPNTGFPKARTDLTAKAGPKGELLSVTNPRTGRTFQVYAFEFRMLQELDGKRSLEELRAAFAAKGHVVTAAMLASFIREMGGYGFLEDSGGAESSRKLVGTPWSEGPPEGEVSFTRWSDEERHLYDAGLKLFREGAMKEAEGYFLATLQVNPDNREARKMLVLVNDAGDAPADELTAIARLDEGSHASQPPAPGPVGESASAAGAIDIDVAIDDAGAHATQSDGAAAASPDAVWDEAASQVTAAPDVKRRRVLARVVRVARVLAIPVLALVVGGFVKYPLKVTYAAVAKPLDRCVVRAPREGVIGDVLVEEGEKVAAHQVLGHMADADQRTKVIQIRSELEKSRADLQLLMEGSRDEEVAKVRARVGGLFHEISVAKARKTRIAGLVKSGVAPRGELEQADAALATLTGEIAQASAELRLVKAGSRPDEIKKKEAEVRGAEAKLAFEQEVLEGAVLRTDLAGVVTTTKPKNLVSTRVAPGDVVFEVASFEAMRAEILVNERDFDVLKLGLPVVLKVASHPTDAFTGIITRIAPQVEVQDGQSVILVEARVPNERGLLVPNMTGYAEIQAEPKPILSLAVRRVLRWIRVRFLI